jgi:hypothetical protein
MTEKWRHKRFVLPPPIKVSEVVDVVRDSVFNEINGNLGNPIYIKLPAIPPVPMFVLEVSNKGLKIYDRYDMSGGLPPFEKVVEPDIILFSAAGKVGHEHDKKVFQGSIGLMENFLRKEYEPTLHFSYENKGKSIAYLILGEKSGEMSIEYEKSLREFVEPVISKLETVSKALD